MMFVHSLMSFPGLYGLSFAYSRHSCSTSSYGLIFITCNRA